MYKAGTIGIAVVILFSGLAAAQQLAIDYSGLYEISSPAIVTITTDDRKGSGFLVTPFGHIATSFHVVRNSRYIAVQFPDGLKVTGAVVAYNEAADMALIKVNSAVVSQIRPLPIIPAEKDEAVKVGIPVVAIGSPNIQDFVMTQGILSRTSERILLGDFVLQPGNSGGPVLNLDGEVIGISTFTDGRMAGAIRMAPLRAIVHSQTIFESVDIEPPAEPLPSVRLSPYPVDILNSKVAVEPLNWDAYQFEAGDFLITAVTPVLIGKVRVLDERMRATNRSMRRNNGGADDMDQQFYAWHEGAGSMLEYAVSFEIQPKTGPIPGSQWSRTLTRIFTFGQVGTLDMEFKGEFLEFRVYRDGKLILPITPGRRLITGQSEEDRFVDQAYAGSYLYDPGEFMHGAEFRLEVVDARMPDEIHQTIVFGPASAPIAQIRSDFNCCGAPETGSAQ